MDLHVSIFLGVYVHFQCENKPMDRPLCKCRYLFITLLEYKQCIVWTGLRGWIWVFCCWRYGFQSMTDEITVNSLYVVPHGVFNVDLSFVTSQIGPRTPPVVLMKKDSFPTMSSYDFRWNTSHESKYITSSISDLKVWKSAICLYTWCY